MEKQLGQTFILAKTVDLLKVCVYESVTSTAQRGIDFLWGLSQDCSLANQTHSWFLMKVLILLEVGTRTARKQNHIYKDFLQIEV